MGQMAIAIGYRCVLGKEQPAASPSFMPFPMTTREDHIYRKWLTAAITSHNLGIMGRGYAQSIPGSYLPQHVDRD